MNISEIENFLRHAPRPNPPMGLKERLLGDIDLPRASARAPGKLKGGGPSGWFRRWWPALAPAAVSAACAVVLTVRQMEIDSLERVAESKAMSSANSNSSGTAPVSPIQSAEAQAALLEARETETSRLKQLAAQLSGEITELEHLQKENQRLQARLMASALGLTPEELQALDKACDRVFGIQCVNNLKQLGLAARTAALDRTNVYPPTVLCMSNEISSFKLLVCPADHGRQAATDPFSFIPANCSYDYLGADAPDGDEPMRILFRCPIHGSVTLFDGSVQLGVAKAHPERIVQRDGKFYLVDPGTVQAQPPTNNPGVGSESKP